MHLKTVKSSETIDCLRADISRLTRATVQQASAVIINSPTSREPQTEEEAHAKQKAYPTLSNQHWRPCSSLQSIHIHIDEMRLEHRIHLRKLFEHLEKHGTPPLREMSLGSAAINMLLDDCDQGQVSPLTHTKSEASG